MLNLRLILAINSHVTGPSFEDYIREETMEEETLLCYVYSRQDKFITV